MLWKWLKTDVDMNKRRNKILTVFSIWLVATLAWIYLLPLISPSGAWLCYDTERSQPDYVLIHENISSLGYTVIVLNQETGKMAAETKDNIISAWLWRLETLHIYSDIEVVQRGK